MAGKNNQNNKLNHKQFFSTLFFCITLLIYSTCFMLENGGITYASVTGAFINILPYCFGVAILGYLIGIILDKPKRYKPKYDKSAIDKLINDISAQEKISMPAPLKLNDDNVSTSSIAEDFDIKVDIEADGQ